MKEDRQDLHLTRLDYDFNGARLDRLEAYLTLSRKDVLGIVQSSFEELGPFDAAILDIKRRVFDEVAEGNLALALRSAIVGAGKRGCRCCE